MSKAYLCVQRQVSGGLGAGREETSVFVHRHGKSIIKDFTEIELSDLNEECLMHEDKIRIDLEKLCIDLEKEKRGPRKKACGKIA